MTQVYNYKVTPFNWTYYPFEFARFITVIIGDPSESQNDFKNLTGTGSQSDFKKLYENVLATYDIPSHPSGDIHTILQSSPKDDKEVLTVSLSPEFNVENSINIHDNPDWLRSYLVDKLTWRNGKEYLIFIAKTIDHVPTCLLDRCQLLFSIPYEESKKIITKRSASEFKIAEDKIFVIEFTLFENIEFKVMNK